MRAVLSIILGLLVMAHGAVAAEYDRPKLFLGSAGPDASRADYAAISLGLGIVDLTFGRPRSAIDDPTFSGPGLSLAQPRSRVALAAEQDQLGAGILIETKPLLGLSFSSSVHGGEQTEETYVAVTGRYTTPDVRQIGQIAVFGGAETDGEEDVFRLGTSLTRGPAVAGFDVTSETGPSERRIAGVFIGLDVNEALSLAISSEVEQDAEGEEQPARFGVGASYSFGRNQTVSGAIGDVTGEEPRFGFMLGLQF